MEAATQTTRLDSPRRSGFRAGVKPYALIGQKLGAMFEVPNETSAAIDALLRQLDHKTCG